MPTNNELSKYIDSDNELLRKHGWKHLVHLQRGNRDFSKLAIDHPARHTFHHLKTTKGAPMVMLTALWTVDTQAHCTSNSTGTSQVLTRAPRIPQGGNGIHGRKGQWVIVHYKAVNDLPGLCISPVGAVPQHV